MTADSNKILIAEDHYVSRHLLERNLTNWGFSVVSAEDGEAALRILDSENAPPIAILDWIMPKLDGAEVCQRVRAIKDRPYVYFVIKPFDPDELRARLKVGQRVVNLERTLARKVFDLEKALADVRKLKELLPICMYCKSIRDDKDYWHHIEEYIHSETGTDFTHGICPKCLAKMQKQLGEEQVKAE